MKINEYNQMMKYLTRPANNLGNNKNKTNTQRRRLAKGTQPDTKDTPKISKIEQFINDNLIAYGDKEASPADVKAALERIEAPKKMTKADKPKSNGKYTIPKTNLDSFDWDMWLRDKPNYTPIEDEKAGLGDIEQDLANEYWQEQYQKYLRNGGTLDFKKYMQMQMQNKISKEVDKRVKDKMQTEGLAAILGVPGNKI
jgi:hypothetical protein